MEGGAAVGVQGKQSGRRDAALRGDGTEHCRELVLVDLELELLQGGGRDGIRAGRHPGIVTQTPSL